MGYLSLDQRGSIVSGFWLSCRRRGEGKIVKYKPSVQDKRSSLCSTWQNLSFAAEIFYPITRRGKSVYLWVTGNTFCLMDWGIFLVLVLCLYFASCKWCLAPEECRIFASETCSHITSRNSHWSQQKMHRYKSGQSMGHYKPDPPGSVLPSPTDTARSYAQLSSYSVGHSVVPC